MPSLLPRKVILEENINTFGWKTLITQIYNAIRGILFVSSTTSSITVKDSVFFVIVDSTSGSVTVTLPLAATCKDKQYCFKKKVAANSMVIAANAADRIDGAASVTKTNQYDTVYVVSDGQTSWYRIV